MFKRTAALIAVILAVAGSAAAQSTSTTDPDTKAIESYQLTVPVLHKMIDASKALKSALQQDPKYREYFAAEKELDALQDKDDPTPADQKRIDALQKQIDAFEQAQESKDDGDAQTLNDMARKISSIPHMTEALQSVGLSPREYATFEMCAMQAGMAGSLPLTRLPAGIQPANVQFMKDHAKEFGQLNADMQGGSK